MDVITQEDEDKVKTLLKYDLESFAKQLGFLNRTIPNLPDNLAIELLNLAESISRKSNKIREKKIALYICALLWEHHSSQWDNIRDVLFTILSRIGLGPSTLMLYEGSDDKPIKSYLNALNISMWQFKDEISVGEKSILLTRPQKSMWTNISKNPVLGISAPTSAGKSFVLVEKVIQTIMEIGGSVVYIVPTISLIGQVTKDISKRLKESNIRDYKVLQSYSHEKTTDKIIYVLTQERALSAFGQEASAFKDLSLLIIDEIQNIERVAEEEDDRSKKLFDVIHEFKEKGDVKKIIVAGARIKGLDKTMKSLFDNSSVGITSELSPVVNISYSFVERNKRLYMNQYTEVFEHITIPLDNTDKICGLNMTRYTDKFHCYLSKVVENLVTDSSTLIFSPTSAQAQKSAIAIGELLPESISSPSINTLLEYVSETLHPEYDLISSLKKGVGFHHGRMPHHLRIAVEHAFSENMIPNLVCTTTLMQGVNLPAKNIIIRNPNLFIRQTKDKPKERLTDYEFGNLRGRAGRLLKDFIGRAIVLDEHQFHTETQETLPTFEDSEKELKLGYGDKFEIYKKQIISDLQQSKVPESDKDYSFYLPYIRQKVLRYGDDALIKLRDVGIELSQDVFINVKKELSNLQIPRAICMRHRYWDPLHLNSLYLAYKNKSFPRIPRSPYDFTFQKNVHKTLFELNKICPYYVEKNLTKTRNLAGYLYILIQEAQKWACEKPLNEILKDNNVKTNEEVNRTVDTLTNKVSYRLTTLLGPIIDIQDPGNPILTFIELGAFNPVTRRMIELGIPRETAIRLNKLIEKENISVLNNKKVDDSLLLIALKRLSTLSEVNYWDKIQFQHMI